MLLPEESPKLKSVPRTGRVSYGMSAAERILLYRTAIETGFRSSEIRSLTRGRLHFDSSEPYITCKAGATKNRKDARQYILTELANAL